MATRWIVVGGGDKGGILVRKGQNLKSEAADERLSTGAVIEEVINEDGRLMYKLISGSGPAEGWVSLKLKDKDLVLPEEEANAAKKFPRMYFHAQVPDQSYAEFAKDYFGRLKAGEMYGPFETYAERLKEGKVRAGATGKQPPKEGDPHDADFEKRREYYEENVPKVKEELERYKHPGPYKRFTKQELEKEAPKMLRGDSYGLEVPPNLDALEQLGAEWLTRAFHATETLPKDNAVTKIVKFKRLPMTTKDAAGGAGAKAFLTLEYGKPDPELHTELFVKMPWDTVGDKSTGGDSLWRFKISGMGDSEYQECTFYHFMERILPFKIPKWYFADICRANTNYILITEKILFGGSAEYLEGKKNKSFDPYVVLPVAEKYFDFEREPKMRYEMYYALMRAQARLAAWDHLTKFAFIPDSITGFNRYPAPLMGQFPFPLKTEKKRKIMARSGETCNRLLRELICDKGRRCYPPELRQEGFLKALESGIIDATIYKDDLGAYCLHFPEKISLMHTNLQSDNAYFWYNADGEIDCGIIDWGGAGPIPWNGMVQGCLTSCEGEVLMEHEVGFLKCYVDEFYHECGISIDLAELYRVYLLTMLVYVGGVCINIENEVFREVPREEWATVNSINDPRVIGNWNTRCYAFMLRSALKYMYCHFTKNGHLIHHKKLLEWVDYWKSQGMQ